MNQKIITTHRRKNTNNSDTSLISTMLSYFYSNLDKIILEIEITGSLYNLGYIERKIYTFLGKVIPPSALYTDIAHEMVVQTLSQRYCNNDKSYRSRRNASWEITHRIYAVGCNP